LRVLILAYACGPDSGSEPEVGWRRVTQAARYFDVWVICEKREFEADIRRHLNEHGSMPHVRFHFVPRPGWRSLWEHAPRSLFYVLYNLWHRRAFRLARRLHERIRFDLVHQLTMCGYREPGYLWKLGPPFVWGPVGGTQDYPWPLLPAAGPIAAVSEGLRSLVNALQFRLSPRVRRVAQKAAVVVTANSRGDRLFRRVHGIATVKELDVGADELRAPKPRTKRDVGPLRLLWMGSLIWRKALHLLIEALALLPEAVDYELTVLGAGPREASLRRLARQRGVEWNILWPGRVPHKQAMEACERADVLAFTSCRDTCGSEVIEALNRGLPVICLDHQGAGDLVTERCGVKVPVGRFADVAAGLRDAIVSLDRDRGKLRDLSRGALERAAEFLWEKKGDKMARIYRRAVAQEAGP
jgi:glycosyltransferase involved in cell wall biosynthesis